MTEREFNLLTEPWIRVMKENCTVEEVSLTDVLLNAHKYRALAGELPTQNVAILRLLLAVLHAVFERVDVNDVPSAIDTSDDAFDRWAELWEQKRFPEKPLIAYLEKQKDSFWLFHPEKPFWQVSKIRENAIRPQSEPIKKINGAISESGNKVRLFSERNGKAKDTLTNSELARWLICMNQYDDNTLKTGLGVAWLGRFTSIIAKGVTLFETLMLNLVLLDYNGEPWNIGPASWEKRWTDSEEVRIIAFPHDPVAILSSHSRFGCFEEERGEIVRYKSAKGGMCFNEVTNDEQMALWKYNSKDDKYSLVTHYCGTEMWREFPSIIADPQGWSGLVKWNNSLLNYHILDLSRMISYEVICIQYDSSQHSSVTNIFNDSIQLHASLLTELGAGYRKLISDEIARCDKIAFYIGILANDLFYAAGGDPKKNTPPASQAKEQYYYEIDVPFRRWLATLNAEDHEPEQKILVWRKEAEQIARKMAEKMVKDAGQIAFVGKMVKTEKGDEKRYYSSSIAMRWFNINMSKLN